MKTRERETSVTTGLPPPPAPTARDANPWTLSTPVARATAAAPETPRAARRRRLAWLPLAIAGLVAATALRGAIEAFAAGDVEAAIGPLVLVTFAAVVAWRRLRGRH
jgi:hypothetical protein